ncbi:MAG: hypothetical protein K9J12_07900 [Melioribacteraceae bacterium]|nr:hypothetical protein [Melioribacteraceae bacterium]
MKLLKAFWWLFSRALLGVGILFVALPFLIYFLISRDHRPIQKVSGRSKTKKEKQIEEVSFEEVA